MCFEVVFEFWPNKTTSPQTKFLSFIPSSLLLPHFTSAKTTTNINLQPWTPPLSVHFPPFSFLFVSFRFVFANILLCIEDPLQGDFPEVIEEYLEYGCMKCIAFNRRGTLLAGTSSLTLSQWFLSFHTQMVLFCFLGIAFSCNFLVVLVCVCFVYANCLVLENGSWAKTDFFYFSKFHVDFGF